MATITVRGTGTVHATPDEATIDLGVEAVRPTAAEALSDVAGRTSSLVTLCHELGLGDRDITTTGVRVAEHGDHDQGGRWQHRGYRATSRVSARIRDVDAVGTLMSAAVDRANATVDGPTWRVVPEHPAHGEAPRLAAHDARTRAQALAEALGGRLGTVVSARDARIPPPEPKPMMRFAAAAAEPVPIEAGDLAVVAVVDVEFNFEQG